MGTWPPARLNPSQCSPCLGRRLQHSSISGLSKRLYDVHGKGTLPVLGSRASEQKISSYTAFVMPSVENHAIQSHLQELQMKCTSRLYSRN